MNYTNLVKTIKGLIVEVPMKRLWLLWFFALTLIGAWRFDFAVLPDLMMALNRLLVMMDPWFLRCTGIALLLLAIASIIKAIRWW